MQQHTIQIFMWAWYPESAKINQKVSGGFWRIQDMSNIYTGGFWWIQDTSILCVTKLVDFGGFRILSSNNTQGVRVNIYINKTKINLCKFAKFLGIRFNCFSSWVHFLCPINYNSLGWVIIPPLIFWWPQFCASQKTALKTSTRMISWSLIEIQHFTRQSFTETPKCSFHL